MRVPRSPRPGHTFTHLSYALDDEAGRDEPFAVFTGGSLLYGATGRPDLLGAGAHRRPGPPPARLGPQARRRAARRGRGLPRPTASARSAPPPSPTPPSSTIGQEKQSNPVLTQDEETYVRELLDGLGAWPAYYAHMAPPTPRDPAPPTSRSRAEADAAELRRRIEAGEWVVDLRNRTAFAAGHAPGTLNFGLDGAFSTYLGWLIEWGTPVTLLGETAERRRPGPARAGPHRHRPAGGPRHRRPGALDHRRAGVASRPPPSPTSTRSGTTATSSSSTSAAPTSTTRPASRARSTSRSTSCPRRVAEVPAGEVWVHCAGGYRASVAASFLDAAGRTLVAVDDSFDNAEKVGLHLVGPDGVTADARSSPSPPARSSASAWARSAAAAPSSPCRCWSTCSTRPRRRRPPARWWSSA